MRRRHEGVEATADARRRRRRGLRAAARPRRRRSRPSRSVPEQVVSAQSFLSPAPGCRRGSRSSRMERTRAAAATCSSRSRLRSGDRWASLLRPDCRALSRSREDRLEGGSRSLRWRRSRSRPAVAHRFRRSVLRRRRRAAREARRRRARYLRDATDKVFLDPVLLREESEQRDGVNSGVIFLPHQLDLGAASPRLAERRWKPTTFTGQTIVHLALHRAGARRFDPSRYVVSTEDSIWPKTSTRDPISCSGTA